MFGIMCIFSPHRWQFICNGRGKSSEFITCERRVGIYQCSRCKTISIGHPDGPHNN